jgi:8-amino-7-oxononanoate synthase
MWINKELKKREIQGNLRTLKKTSQLIDFASNDYLGLARSDRLKKAILQEWTQGVGSTGSRLLTGNSLYAETVEDKIAQFHGCEAGLLFSCGYLANLGLFSAIGAGNVIVYDTQIHASVHDGMRLGKGKTIPFRHNDLCHLEKRLRSYAPCFVCVESVYSTDGSFAPLQELVILCQHYGAELIVDEAHAVGVFGPQGKGRVYEEGLTVFAQVITFGKALGSQGAIVLGSSELKSYLLNFARSVIYTTSLSFPSLVAVNCGYDLLPQMEEERLQLFKNIALFKQIVKTSSSSPIQPIVIPGNEHVKARAQKLQQIGCDVRPLTSPTVQRGKECLRICVHAFNTEKEIQHCLEHL